MTTKSHQDLEHNSSTPPLALEKRHSDLELAWSDIVYVAPKRQQPILNHVTGLARSGELLAVMGPSGAGKSTFLDAICGRSSAQGEVTINGSTSFSTQDLFSFVEQDDALLGVLTVRETVAFAAKLSLGSNYPGIDRHIDSTLRSLGLQDIANNKIGTPLQRGISGGQKRRVTIACSVVTKPQILVLDEPTSGLDASSSREVVTFLRYLAKELNMLVIATIHQPNFETFSLFDNLLLLAGGRTMYNGPVAELDAYLAWTGSPTPKFCNPADHCVQLVNTEFMKRENSDRSPLEHLSHYSDLWNQYQVEKPRHSVSSDHAANSANFGNKSRSGIASLLGNFRKLNVLMHRNLLNYSRNILAYGIRLGMYMGMALLLATIWIHLGYSAEKINDRLSVSFFSVAFLGFMSVAGIPSFLEERSVFIRERRNGLYGSGVYALAQSIVSIPFLFVCSLVFSLIIYWSIGMNPGADHFFKFLVYLFLALYTAESQSLLVAAIFPLFVAALAIASFANGLWMCNMGYFIRTSSLPRFWFYVVHWIDYQTYSFNLLVKNDFAEQVLNCPVINGSCSCPIPSSLTPSQCALAGDDVIRNLNISGSEGMSVGLLILICLVFRFAFYFALRLRK